LLLKHNQGRILWFWRFKVSVAGYGTNCSYDKKGENGNPWDELLQLSLQIAGVKLFA